MSTEPQLQIRAGSWLAWWAVAAAVFAIAWTALALASMSSLNGCTAGSRWIEGLYRADDAALGRTTPAVMIVGGSGVHFGMSAGALRAAGIPAVNYGTHAGLGLPFLLDRALEASRPGDVILLMPEYEHYRDEGRVDDALLEYAACKGPSLLKTLPKIELARRLFTTPAKQLIQNFFSNDGATRRYRIGTTDAFGDETINTPAARRATDLPFIRGQGIVTIPDQPTATAAGTIHRFLEDAGRKKVRVIVAWPGLYRGAAPPAARIEGLAGFWARSGVPVVGCYEESLLDEPDMFDTVYHANTTGARLHAQRLAPYLAAYMRNDLAHASCASVPPR